MVYCGDSTILGCTANNGYATCSTSNLCTFYDSYGQGNCSSSWLFDFEGTTATSQAVKSTVNFVSAGGAAATSTFLGSVTSISGPLLGPNGIIGLAKQALSSVGAPPSIVRFMAANNYYSAFTL